MINSRQLARLQQLALGEWKSASPAVRKSFHSSPRPCAAQKMPNISRKRAAQATGATRLNSEALPPLGLVEVQYKSGALKLNPVHAARLMEDIGKLAPKLGSVKDEATRILAGWLLNAMLTVLL